MKAGKLPVRILNIILSLAILLQGGFATPVFAVEDYDYRANYDWTLLLSSVNDIGPDGDTTGLHAFILDSSDMPYNYGNGKGNYGEVLNLAEPHRMIGYTFEGWFTGPNGTGDKIDDMVLTEEYISSKTSGLFEVYAYRKPYDSPLLNNDTVAFTNKNANKEYLTDEFKLFDSSSYINETTFDSDTTEYYLYTYGDTQYMNISFEQYEPDATSTVTIYSTVDGSSETNTADCTATDIKGDGYFWDSDGFELEKRTVTTGKSYVSDYFKLGDKNTTTQVDVTVRMNFESSTGVYSEKTYTFYIYRYGRELKANYGNTPYGALKAQNNANLETQLSNFDSTHLYGGKTYNPSMWNYEGIKTNEVVKGSVLGEDDYINYDKDDTAIVVYSGERFTDPGITIYNDDGTEVTSYSVERTINYKTILSLLYTDWFKVENPMTKSDTLTGENSNENIIDILQNEQVGLYVRPGIYTISYKYSWGGLFRDMTVTRNIIVLPQQGDLNMDNYLNGLDVLAYEKDFSADASYSDDKNQSYSLYKYGALDYNSDGIIDDNDKDSVKNRTSSGLKYVSLSVKDDAALSPTDYTIPASASGDKAQLYMEYMGKSNGDTTSNLELKDTFYIGYRFENLQNADLDSGNLREITMSLDFDTRYVDLNITSLDGLISWIKANNENLSNAEILLATRTISTAAYTFDKSTAKIFDWSGTLSNNIKTLRVQAFLTEADAKKLTSTSSGSEDTFIKLPFRVKNIPPSADRTVISARLDAKGFNMNAGGIDYDWDTSDKLISASVNLKKKIEYMGDCKLNFGAEADATPLTDGVYGTPYGYSGLPTNSSVEDGNLPSGLSYSASGTIAGTPTEVGTFKFYISGTQYSITIDKAPLTVTVEDNEKLYGNDNPSFNYLINESDLRNSDTSSSVRSEINGTTEEGVTGLSYTTAADGTTPVGSYTVLFDEDHSISEITNYYLVYEDGTLTINKRPIKITAITNIPACSDVSITRAVSGTTSTEYTAVYSPDSSKAGILNGDTVTITYSVTYTDSNFSPGGSKQVTIYADSISIEESGNYANYELSEQGNITNNLGSIVSAYVSDFVVTEWCKTGYTYGEAFDLDSGSITIYYKDLYGTITPSAPLTFSEAIADGLVVYLTNESDTKYMGSDLTGAKKLQTGYKVTIDADNGSSVNVYMNPDTTNNVRGKLLKAELVVNPVRLTITADDKSKTYGEPNPSNSYTLTGGSIITGDTENSIITNVNYFCDADASSDVGDYDINVTAESGSHNYTITCVPGTLTVNKRKITVTNVTNIPELTADLYMNADATYKTQPYTVEATAVSDGSSPQAAVTNLYSTDAVKVSYDVEYSHHTEGSTNVAIKNLALVEDENYPKNSNYELNSTSIESVSGGLVRPKAISEIKVNKPLTQSYDYGDRLDIKTGEIYIKYDYGEEFTQNFYDAVNDHSDLSFVYDSDSSAVTDGRLLTVVDDNGKTMTLTAKSYHFDEDFTWDGTLNVTRAPLTVTAENKYATYGNEIPEFTYTITGFKNGEDDSVLSSDLVNISCLSDDGTTEIVPGVSSKPDAGRYTIDLSGSSTDGNYRITYVDAMLMVTQRALAITNISVEDLTAQQAYEASISPEGTYSESITVRTDEDTENIITFDDNYKLLEGDKIEIGYTIKYAETPLAGKDNVTVDIISPEIVLGYGDVRNYYIMKCVTESKGNVVGALISGIEMTTDPTENEYSYGDTLDLSNGVFTVIYDSTRRVSGVSFDDLINKYGFTAVYTDVLEEEPTPLPLITPTPQPTVIAATAPASTAAPTTAATTDPAATAAPTTAATTAPTTAATTAPTTAATTAPTTAPTATATAAPTTAPTATAAPTTAPTTAPTAAATTAPSSASGEGEAAKSGVFLTMPYNGRTIKITPPAEFSTAAFVAESEENPLITDGITVNKREMHIAVDDAEYTYGDTPAGSIYAFEFVDDDFAEGENRSNILRDASYTAPVLACIVDGEAADGTVPAGSYTDAITASGGESRNYEFVYDTYKKGTLTVNKRDIRITSIDDNSIPPLTTTMIRQSLGENTVKVSGSSAYSALSTDNTMSVTNTVNNDTVGIVFDAYYDLSNLKYGQNVTVAIDTESIEFDEQYADCGNYNIIAPLPSSSDYGFVQQPVIDSLEVTEDPLMTYSYGESFKLSGGYVKITYANSDGYYETATFAELGNYNIIPTYETTGDIVYDSGYITVTDHNGSRIKLTLTNTEGETITAYTLSSLTVTPKTMHITIEDQAFTYGEEPPVFNLETGSPYPDLDGKTDMLYHYAKADLVNGDTFTDDTFKKTLDKYIPVLNCSVTGTSDAGTYSITGSDKVLDENASSNYVFEYETGELTINKRPVTVNSIDSGIPALTSAIIYNSKAPYKVAGFAATDDANNHITAENVLAGDNIGITYNAVYSSSTPSSETETGIADVALDNSYGKSRNYTISSFAGTAGGGVVYEREITAIEIVEQPVLQYTYGDRLDLNSGRIRVTYDDGSSETVKFNQLPSDKVSLTYSDGKRAADGDLLTVKYHNKNTIKVSITSPYKVKAVTTSKMTVYKKKLNVDAKDVTTTYGDDIALSFEYRAADFVNGDEADSSLFTSGLTEPVVSSRDNNNKAVGKTTPAGIYEILLSGGKSDNYEFIYNNAVLTIERRPIDIMSVDSGVPILTAKFIHENSGPSYRLDGSAVNTEGQMTVNNLVNGDTIKISYTAVYSTTNPGDNVRVNLEKVALVETYAKSSNYVISYSTMSSPNGRVITSNIENIYITVLPKMEYYYGDELDLSGGTLHIDYDDSSMANVSFEELAKANNQYGISLTYADTGGNVINGAVMTIDGYNGRQLQFKVNESIYNVSSVITDGLKVSKRVLRYGVCQVNPITYDGKTTLTDGKIVFINTLSSETPTASGTFEFENSSAGVNKLVNITGITLDSEFTDRYELAEDKTTAYGTIEKANLSINPSGITYELSDETNVLIITAPDMTEEPLASGAQYEYSIDGGLTWQDSNVFENLALGQVCSICVRFAETDNYNHSAATAPITVTAYKVELTLISIDSSVEDPEEVIKSLYTNTETVETEAELRAVIGDTEVEYYNVYLDEEKTVIVFPLELTGDVNIYTTVTKPTDPRKHSGGGGGGGGSSYNSGTKSTTSPIAIETTPSPEATPEASPEASPTQYPSGSLNKNEPYLSGFNNLIRPDDYMTRAEAATLMVILSGDTGENYPNIFSDVKADAWYTDYIAQAYARGLIAGYDDGLFYPEITVTREQFAAMVVRLAGLEEIAGQTFADVEDWRWSAGSINAAVEAGIVSGYDDGTFKPENPIRRSEAVRMINVATGRIPDKDVIDQIPCPYTDLPKTHWAYYEFMIASVKL